MNWRIQKACEIERKQYDDLPTWSVNLLEPALAPLTIGLCLLRNELISELDIEDHRGQLSMRMTRQAEPIPHRATVRWHGEWAGVALSLNELEYLMFFLLRTMRDGAAAVDHIDLEAAPADRHQQPGDFVLKFPHSAPPLSPEELRRRLGL